MRIAKLLIMAVFSAGAVVSLAEPAIARGGVFIAPAPRAVVVARPVAQPRVGVRTVRVVTKPAVRSTRIAGAQPRAVARTKGVLVQTVAVPVSRCENFARLARGSKDVAYWKRRHDRCVASQ